MLLLCFEQNGFLLGQNGVPLERLFMAREASSGHGFARLQTAFT